MTPVLRTGGLAWLAVAGAALVEGLRLGVGTLRQPGPGFVPVLAALVLAGLAVGLLLQPAGEPPPPAPGGRRRFAAAVGALLAYAALFERLGFVPTTFVVMWFLLSFVGAARWPVALGFAAATAVSAWLVFDRLLQAQLPRGVLAPLGL